MRPNPPEPRTTFGDRATRVAAEKAFAAELDRIPLPPILLASPTPLPRVQRLFAARGRTIVHLSDELQLRRALQQPRSYAAVLLMAGPDPAACRAALGVTRYVRSLDERFPVFFLLADASDETPVRASVVLGARLLMLPLRRNEVGWVLDDAIRLLHPVREALTRGAVECLVAHGIAPESVAARVLVLTACARSEREIRAELGITVAGHRSACAELRRRCGIRSLNGIIELVRARAFEHPVPWPRLL